MGSSSESIVVDGAVSGVAGRLSVVSFFARFVTRWAASTASSEVLFLVEGGVLTIFPGSLRLSSSWLTSQAQGSSGV